MTKVYQALASKVDAYHRCVETGNDEWQQRHLEAMTKITQDAMPRGSGFDSGTTLYPDESTGEKLVFFTAFHHMNDVGMYDGWTEHKVTVRPSLVHGIDVRVSGQNKREIKDYIAELFDQALREETSL